MPASPARPHVRDQQSLIRERGSVSFLQGMALASDQGHQGGGKLLLFRLQTDYAFPGKSPLRETRAFRGGARTRLPHSSRKVACDGRWSTYWAPPAIASFS